MHSNLDSVIEEIRATRRKLYARCGNDPHKYGTLLAAAATQRKARTAKKAKAKQT